MTSNNNDQFNNDFDTSLSLSLFPQSSNGDNELTSQTDNELTHTYLNSLSLLEPAHVMRSIAMDVHNEIYASEHQDGASSSSTGFYNNLYSLNDKTWMNEGVENDEYNFDNNSDKVGLPFNYTVTSNQTQQQPLLNSLDELIPDMQQHNLTASQLSECKQYLPLSLPPPVIEPFYSFSIHSEKLSNDNINEQFNILLTIVDALNSFMPLTSILESCDDDATCPLSNSSDVSTKDLTVDFDIRPSKQRFQGVVYSNACTSTAAAALFSLQVYVNGNQCIVEIQRRYGCCRVFCKFFRALKSLIGQSYEIEDKPFPNLGAPKTINSTDGIQSIPNPPLPQLSMREAHGVFQSLGLCQASSNSEGGESGKNKRIGTLHCYMQMLSNLVPIIRSQILDKQQDAMRLLCDIFAPRPNEKQSSSASDEPTDFDINLAIQALQEHEKQYAESDLSFSALLRTLLTANDWELRYYTSTLCYYLAQYSAMRELFMSKGSPLYAAMSQIQHHPSSSNSLSSSSSSSQQTFPTIVAPQSSSIRSSLVSSEEDDDYQFRNSRRQLAKALHTCG